MSTVSVTGATGFLGHRLCLRLIQQGYQVRGLGRSAAIGEKLTALGVQFLRGDINDQAYLDKAFSQAEFVVHSAGCSSPWGSYKEFHSANVMGTAAVVAACRAQNVSRLIHISTSSVYFSYKDRFDILEDDELPRQFANYYAHTKYMAENIVRNACKDGLNALILRPRGLIGAEDPSVLPRVIRALKRGRFPLFKGGEALVDLTHVENVAHAIILALSVDNASSGKIYNITNDQPVRVKALIEIISQGLGIPFNPLNVSYEIVYPFARLLEAHYKVLGREPPFTAYTLGLIAYSATLNIDAAKSDLKYQPIVSLADGLQEFMTWWKQQ